MRQMNPIWKKEMTINARAGKMPVAIMCYCIVMTVISIAMLATASTVTQYQIFQFSVMNQIFLVIAFSQMGAMCIIIPVLTAGSIAGERERQTLDLLLTSPLNSMQIVVGKLASCLSNVFLFIIASLPSMAVAFIYGGLQWRFLFIFLLGIMIASFFLGSVGIWCATVYKKTTMSIVMTLLVELVFCVGTVSTVFLIFFAKEMTLQTNPVYSSAGTASYVPRMGWIPAIVLLNPVAGFANAIMKTYTGVSYANLILSDGTVGNVANGLIRIAQQWHWISFGVSLVMGYLFLRLAARKLDNVRKEDKVHGKKVKEKTKK